MGNSHNNHRVEIIPRAHELLLRVRRALRGDGRTSHGQTQGEPRGRQKMVQETGPNGGGRAPSFSKAKLAESLALYQPQLDKPFVLRTEASDTAIGAQLMQELDGKLRTVALYSRKLTGNTQLGSEGKRNVRGNRSTPQVVGNHQLPTSFGANRPPCPRTLGDRKRRNTQWPKRPSGSMARNTLVIRPRNRIPPWC